MELCGRRALKKSTAIYIFKQRKSLTTAALIFYQRVLMARIPHTARTVSYREAKKER
jgi:hypothetical protein